MRPEARLRAARTLACCAAVFALGLSLASLGPSLQALASRTRSGLDDVALLISARSLGALAGAWGIGRLYDRSRGNLLLAASLGVMAACLGAMPAIGVLALLAALSIALGIAEGAVDAGGNALLLRTHGAGAGPFMIGMHFCFGLGAFLSPILVARGMARDGDVAGAYGALAMVVTGVALLAAFVPAASPPRGIASAPEERPDPLLVGLLALFLFVYVGAELGFGGWIAAYAVNRGLADQERAAYLASAFWGALALGRVAGIPLAGRLSPKAILIADLIGGLASIGVILGWPDSLRAAAVGSFGLGFSLATVFPVTFTLAQRWITVTGRITGWFLVGAYTGGMLLPWLAGRLFDAVGPRGVMAAILGDLSLGLAVLLVILARGARAKASPVPA